MTLECPPASIVPSSPLMTASAFLRSFARGPSAFSLRSARPAALGVVVRELARLLEEAEEELAGDLVVDVGVDLARRVAEPVLGLLDGGAGERPHLAVDRPACAWA